MAIVKDGRTINSMARWLELAPPKSPGHWKAGRSAMETARAWLGGGDGVLPAEVEALLVASPHFGTPLRWTAEPEAKLRFDSFAGEPRNSDLLMIGTDAKGDYVVAVEAKADETFGGSVATALRNAAQRKEKNPRSNGELRIQQLEEALLGAQREGEAPLSELRYQLLTATAGLLCEAERRGATRAVLLIHEFVTDETSDDKHEANGKDMDFFVQRLSHSAQLTAPAGQLLGPFAVPGGKLLRAASDVQLFVGKAVRKLRTVSQRPG